MTWSERSKTWSLVWCLVLLAMSCGPGSKPRAVQPTVSVVSRSCLDSPPPAADVAVPMLTAPPVEAPCPVPWAMCLSQSELEVIGRYIQQLESQNRALLRYARLAWTLCGDAQSETPEED